jgi:hypothetical protein
MTYLVVFYPYYRLWRKFYLKLNGNSFTPIDSGVYLRHGRNIYVVGGCRIKYETIKENKDNK